MMLLAHFPILQGSMKDKHVVQLKWQNFSIRVGYRSYSQSVQDFESFRR